MTITAPLDTRTKLIPLLILAGLCAYAGSLTGAFVLDDGLWISDNIDLRTPGLFTVHAFPDRWLVAATIEANYQVGGLKVTGYHVVNIATHILAGVALFGVVRRTLLLPRWQGRFETSAASLAFAVALLWLVHPLNTQSVTYIIQRCESMMGLFYLLTIYCLIRADAATANVRWQVLAALCFTLGMGCKEVAVTAPIVALIYDRVFLADSWRTVFARRWRLYALLGAVTAAYLARIVYQLAHPATGDVIGFSVRDLTPLTYLMSQAEVILHYLRLAFWPVGLCLDYSDWPVVTTFADCVLPGLCVLALVIASLVAVAFRSWAGFLGVWFFLILAPTSTVLPIIDLAFEHRMYLSLAAVVVVVVVVGGHMVVRTAARRGVLPGRSAGLVQGVFLLVLGLTLGGLTFHRNAVYHHPYTLWADVIAQRPNNVRALVNIQPHLEFAGRTKGATALLAQAREKNPRSNLVVRSRVNALMQEGQLAAADESLTLLDQMVAAYTGKTRADLAGKKALLEGLLDIKKGEPRRALPALQSASALLPHDAMARFALAAVLQELGRDAEAQQEYAVAIALNPSFPRHAEQRARWLVLDTVPPRPDQRREALSLAYLACIPPDELTPGRLDTLALTQAANGRFPEAAATARQALALAEVQHQGAWLTVLQARVRAYEAGRLFEKTP